MQAITHRAVVLYILLVASSSTSADLIPVRHLEGVPLGFLVLRSSNGETLAYGTMKQVADPAAPVITDDLRFEFKAGSLYREITKFTQRTTFHLLSNHIVQKGPTFKQQQESWIDVRAGTVIVRSPDSGKQKEVSKHLNLPPDLANGLPFTLVKNMDSTLETALSFAAVSNKPRIVRLIFRPSEEKPVAIGNIKLKTQHFIMKVKIEGAAGAVAPLLGQQPPEAHFWTIKSESPTFVAFEGQLVPEGPIWKIELAAPKPIMGT